MKATHSAILKYMAVLGAGLAALHVSSGCATTTAAPAVDAGPAVTDTGADAPVGATFQIWVYSEAPTIGQEPTPLSGAIVAYDPPGGGPRQEVTTGPDGLAKLDGDLAKGAGAITVSAVDHGMVTFLDVSLEAIKSLPPNQLGKPATDLVTILTYNGTERSIQVSGQISGKAAADNTVLLSARSVQDRVEVSGATYSMRVPKGVPFSLFGIEGKGASSGREIRFSGARFFRIEGQPASADTKLDLDVSQGTIPSSTSTFKIELPGGDTGPLGGSTLAFCQVQSIDSGVLLGMTTKSGPAADLASFDCEMRSATVDIAPEALQTLVAVQTTDGAVSISAVFGAVPDGTVFKDLLPPPALTVQTQKLSDPVLTEGLPKAASTCQIQLIARNKVLWSVLGPFQKPCPTSMAIPAPPTGVALPSSVKARLVGLADPTEVPGRKGVLFFKRVSASRLFTVTTR